MSVLELAVEAAVACRADWAGAVDGGLGGGLLLDVLVVHADVLLIDGVVSAAHFGGRRRRPAA